MNCDVGISYASGNYIYNQVNHNIIIDNCNYAFRIRNNSIVTYSVEPIYINNVGVLITNGEVPNYNYGFYIYQLIGTPVTYLSTTLLNLGYINLDKNIHILIPGINN